MLGCSAHERRQDLARQFSFTGTVPNARLLDGEWAYPGRNFSLGKVAIAHPNTLSLVVDHFSELTNEFVCFSDFLENQTCCVDVSGLWRGMTLSLFILVYPLPLRGGSW